MCVGREYDPTYHCRGTRLGANMRSRHRRIRIGPPTIVRVLELDRDLPSIRGGVDGDRRLAARRLHPSSNPTPREDYAGHSRNIDTDAVCHIQVRDAPHVKGSVRWDVNSARIGASGRGQCCLPPDDIQVRSASVLVEV